MNTLEGRKPVGGYPDVKSAIRKPIDRSWEDYQYTWYQQDLREKNRLTLVDRILLRAVMLLGRISGGGRHAS